MQRKSIWISLAVLLVLIIVLIAFRQPYQFRGSVIEQDYPAPDFKLIDADGQEYRLSAQQGNIVLLFFGYASCPDVCPTTLSDLKQTFNILDDLSEEVQVVFITLDPDRDTPEKIQAYTSLFNQKFLGLSGDMETLEPIWKAYGVFREIDEETVTEAGYLVSHSARIYLIDQEGHLRITYTFGTPPEDIAEDIAHLLD